MTLWVSFTVEIVYNGAFFYVTLWGFDRRIIITDRILYYIDILFWSWMDSTLFNYSNSACTKLQATHNTVSLTSGVVLLLHAIKYTEMLK